MSEASVTPGAARVKRALRPILVLVAIGFIALSAWELTRRWEPQDIELSPVWGALALVLAVAAPLPQAVGWLWLIEHLTGHRPPGQPCFELYLDSQLARYTPGKVGLPAVCIAGAASIGVSGRIVGTSIFIEVLSWCGVGSAVGFAVLVVGGPPGDVLGLVSHEASIGGAVLLSASAALVVAALCVVDRRRLPQAWLRTLGISGSGPLLSYRVPLAHALHWLAWAACGAAFAIALGAPARAAVGVGGVVVLAIVIGFAALFAPAGAGVREAVIGVGAASVLGAPAAVALSVLARGASLVADVSCWLAVRVWGRRLRRTGA